MLIHDRWVTKQSSRGLCYSSPRSLSSQNQNILGGNLSPLPILIPRPSKRVQPIENLDVTRRRLRLAATLSWEGFHYTFLKDSGGTDCASDNIYHLVGFSQPK